MSIVKTRFCRSCGTASLEGQKFCGNCGCAFANQVSPIPEAGESAASVAGFDMSQNISIRDQDQPGEPEWTATLVAALETKLVFRDAAGTARFVFDFTRDSLRYFGVAKGPSVSMTVVKQNEKQASINLLLRFDTQDLAYEFNQWLWRASESGVRRRNSLSRQDAAPRERAEPATTEGYGIRVLGGWLIAGGSVIVAYFVLFFSTAVAVPTSSFGGYTLGGGSVNNIGLIADRQLGTIVGLGACLLGALILLLRRPK
jgi:hypothetical protein